MTLWQFLYITILYFALGEALHRNLSNGEGSMLRLYCEFLAENADSVFVVVFVTLTYLLWPPTLVCCWWLARQETIAAVTKKLTRIEPPEELL